MFNGNKDSQGEEVKPILAITLFLLLTGCEYPGNLFYPNPPSGVPGITVDAPTADALQADFYAAQDCSGIYAGEFSSLSIILTNDVIPCPSNGTCLGLFTKPNIIQVMHTFAPHGAFAHEALHYLLIFRYGNPDGAHVSPEWGVCRAAGVVW